MDSLFEKCKKLTHFKMSILRKLKTATLEWEKGTGRWKGGIVGATAESSDGKKTEDTSLGKEGVCGSSLDLMMRLLTTCLSRIGAPGLNKAEFELLNFLTVDRELKRVFQMPAQKEFLKKHRAISSSRIPGQDSILKERKILIFAFAVLVLSRGAY